MNRPAAARGTEAETREPGAVRAMFDGIARRYDFANHLLSGGVDFWWRRRAARMVQGWQPRRVLDLASGTGDMALALAKVLPAAEITAADFSAEMLAIARRKGVTQTVVTDALALPFPDRSFDCVTVAFGLRNMQDWGAALREMARVLVPGGHLLVLDFSMPTSALLPVYKVYLHHVLPGLAGLVTGKKDAYEYLGATIEKFPSGPRMVAFLEQNGFASASATPLTGGIATIYCASVDEEGRSSGRPFSAR